MIHKTGDAGDYVSPESSENPESLDGTQRKVENDIFLSKKQVLNLIDSSRDFDNDDDRIPLLHAFGLVIHLNSKTNQEEIILLDKINKKTGLPETVIPGLKSNFGESARNTLDRAMKKLTGYWPRGKEWLIHTWQTMDRTIEGTKHDQLKHVATWFLLRVDYFHEEISEKVQFNPDDIYSNIRWEPITAELVESLTGHHKKALQVYMKRYVDFVK